MRSCMNRRFPEANMLLNSHDKGAVNLYRWLALANSHNQGSSASPGEGGAAEAEGEDEGADASEFKEVWGEHAALRDPGARVEPSESSTLVRLTSDEQFSDLHHFYMAEDDGYREE